MDDVSESCIHLLFQAINQRIEELREHVAVIYDIPELRQHQVRLSEFMIG